MPVKYGRIEADPDVAAAASHIDSRERLRSTRRCGLREGESRPEAARDEIDHHGDGDYRHSFSWTGVPL